MSGEGAELPAVCILAGGLGTRLGDSAAGVPKSAVEVAGEPFIRHQLRLLAANGAGRVVVCSGHLAGELERAAGSGKEFGLDLSFARDPSENAGTAGAVRGALDLLGDPFLVLYGDTYLRIDYRDFARAFEASGMPAQMAVLRNEGRWDASNADFDGSMVGRYDKPDASSEMRWIDYGLGGFRRAAFESGAGATASDLADIYRDLASEGRLAGYEATERFYEIGTPEALAETDRFLRDSGLR